MMNEEFRNICFANGFYLKIRKDVSSVAVEYGAGHFNFYKGSPYGRAPLFARQRTVRGYTAVGMA